MIPGMHAVVCAHAHRHTHTHTHALQFGRYFECDKRNATFFSELRAGLICFLTVAYIIPVSVPIFCVRYSEIAHKMIQLS